MVDFHLQRVLLYKLDDYFVHVLSVSPGLESTKRPSVYRGIRLEVQGMATGARLAFCLLRLLLCVLLLCRGRAVGMFISTLVQSAYSQY